MAIGVAALSIFIQLLFLLLKPMAPLLLDHQTAWVIAAAILLFYTIFNSITTIYSANIGRNWLRSIYGFVSLACFSFLLAQLMSGLRLKEIPDFKSVIFMIVIGFLILKSIATLIHEVVLYTKRKDAEKSKREHPK
jgi:hypothetical protein